MNKNNIDSGFKFNDKNNINQSNDNSNNNKSEISMQNIKKDIKKESKQLKMPNPKEETIYTDSLSKYTSDPSIKQSQIQLVRELLKCSDAEKASQIMYITAIKLIKDSNIGVRRIISWSLRHSQDKISSIKLLLDSIKEEKSWIVLEEMILSLTYIFSLLKEEEKRIYSKISNETIQTIVSNLSHNRHPVRIAAIKGCAILKIKEAKYKLEEMSIFDPVLKVREKAKTALEQLQR